MDGTVAPEQIIINGQEYTPEDASQLIEFGNKYREIEKNLNTSLDKLMPEYTKATQKAARLEEIEKTLAEKNRALEELQKKQEALALPEEKLNARKAAREIGLVDDDYLNEKGYIKKSDLDEYFSQKETQKQLVDNVMKQAGALEKEIDGSDGRVPFDQKAVLAYASAYNIADLKDAYEQMNERANASWKARQIESAERPGLTTLKPGGKKAPVAPKVTDDNFGQMWEEMFGKE